MRRTDRHRRLLIPVAALLAATGTGMLLDGAGAQVPAPPALPRHLPDPLPGLAPMASAGRPPGSREPAGRAPAKLPVLAASAPTRLRIPKLGVSTPLERLRLTRDGSLQAPVSGVRPGWYADGTTPGSPGTALIAGHVTFGGPAVFFKLALLRPGDMFSVERADHRTAGFTVTKIAGYSRRSVPASVYESSRGAEVRLITCGGRYDDREHRYADNVVVFARLSAVSSPPVARKPPARPAPHPPARRA